MRFIRAWLKRGRTTPPKPEPLTVEKIDYAYTIYWMKTARQWDGGRRARMAERVTAAIESPHFSANAFERKYEVEGLDEIAHSGASLLALAKVLEALEVFD